MHLYAKNTQKYARYVSMKVICKICKNMHSPLCWCCNVPGLARAEEARGRRKLCLALSSRDMYFLNFSLSILLSSLLLGRRWVNPGVCPVRSRRWSLSGGQVELGEDVLVTCQEKCHTCVTYLESPVQAGGLGWRPSSWACRQCRDSDEAAQAA